MVWKEGKSLTNKEKGLFQRFFLFKQLHHGLGYDGTVSHAFNIHDMGQVHKLTPTQGCHLTARHEGHAQLGKRLDNPTARTLGIGCPVGDERYFPMVTTKADCVLIRSLPIPYFQYDRFIPKGFTRHGLSLPFCLSSEG